MASLFAYTVHPNWKWVVQESLSSESPGPVVYMESPRDLPSQKRGEGEKGGDSERVGKQRRQRFAYALFRYELVHDQTSTTAQMTTDAWATSLAFANLDAKDALYRALSNANAAHLMPKTYLLRYDLASIEGMPENLPSMPCSILKAALGSGGDCLFFVRSKSAILDVITDHKRKAESFPGFIESLVREYGAVPAWSLQAYHIPLCIDWFGKRRRSQFRVYCVYSQLPKKAVYIYNQVEVRLPEWNIDLDSLLGITSEKRLNDGHDFDLCRPYNEGRNKTLTDRVTLMEISKQLELELGLMEGESTKLQDKILSHVLHTMQALQEQIISNVKPPEELPFPVSSSSTSFTSLSDLSRNEVAVVGIDILLSSTGQPYILEFNNNPAMPQQHKRMSDAYKEHLINLMSSIKKLVCHHTNENSFMTVDIQ